MKEREYIGLIHLMAKFIGESTKPVFPIDTESIVSAMQKQGADDAEHDGGD
ncbi:hypothetical protein [Berryella intestinalis]|uniref:hypothetical protein n=1 Tax=Berryella intestinalis TaxID=1531429 RepID=UPI00130DDB5D|nr:hypothetical protein [Berryella intestinalis]